MKRIMLLNVLVCCCLFTCLGLPSDVGGDSLVKSSGRLLVEVSSNFLVLSFGRISFGPKKT